MQKKELLYEGKAKKVYATEDENLCIVSYKDAAADASYKGDINNKITNHLMKQLTKTRVPTHFVKQLSDTDTLVKKVDIIPIKVIVRNIVAGSLSRRIGIKEGTRLRSAVVEFCYKNEKLDFPLINEYHIAALELCTTKQLSLIVKYSLKANEFLVNYLKSAEIKLIDFKLEFGLTSDGAVVLADEISPDTCRFWDTQSGEMLDKDRFRGDMGDTPDAYNEVLKRLLGE